jgi:hypothetical protein
MRGQAAAAGIDKTDPDEPEEVRMAVTLQPGYVVMCAETSI